MMFNKYILTTFGTSWFAPDLNSNMNFEDLDMLMAYVIHRLPPSEPMYTPDSRKYKFLKLSLSYRYTMIITPDDFKSHK